MGIFSPYARVFCFFLLFSLSVFAQDPPKPPPALLSAGIIKQTLCAPKECRVVAAWNAGKDDKGRDMSIIGIEFPADPALPPPPTKTNLFDGSLSPCLPAPHWLLRSRDGVVESKEEIITLFKESECSYGVAGGEEWLTLEGPLLSFGIYGGSAWRWGSSKTWWLSPVLTKIRETEDSYWHIDLKSFSVDHDVENQIRHVSWFTPYAGEKKGCSEEEVINEPCYFFDEIPLAQASGALTRFLRVDSSGKGSMQTGGFVIHGEPAKPSDAAFKVAAIAPDTLVIEIEDDVLQSTNPSWIKNDHLEIWADQNKGFYHYKHQLYRDGSPEAQKASTNDVVVKKPVQWGIDLAGKVFAGFGTPKIAPKVEVSGKRFKITLPFTPAHLTVVYSDTDDGKSQERLLATSKLIFGEALSLGKIELFKGE